MAADSRDRQWASGAEANRDLPAIVPAALGSRGRPLDRSAQVALAPSFGQRVSQVRVHTGPTAAASAAALNAAAYSVGQDVVFGQGEYNPDTSGGRELIAHELSHVEQQSIAGQVTLQRKSLSGEYEDQIMKNLDKGNYVRGYLWTLLYTAHNALTFGFLSAHDPAYDAYEQGKISEEDYLKATLKATGRSVAIGGAVIVTGGIAGAAGEGLATGFGASEATLAPIIGGTVGGAASGGAGQLTGDLYDIATGDRTSLSSAADYEAAIGFGAAGGFVTSTVGVAASARWPGQAQAMGRIYQERFPNATRFLSGVRGTSMVAGARLASAAGIRSPVTSLLKIEPGSPAAGRVDSVAERLRVAAASAYQRLLGRTATTPAAKVAFKAIDAGQDWSGAEFGKAMEAEMQGEVGPSEPTLVYQRQVAQPGRGLTARQQGGRPDWRLPLGGGNEAVFDATMDGSSSVGKAYTKYGSQPTNQFVVEILYPRPPHMIQMRIGPPTIAPVAGAVGAPHSPRRPGGE
jgi:Domain of unknown function (DUF4157)